MFRENNSHKQAVLFDSSNWMNPKIREKLEKSWAPIFYEHVFCQIDEKPFAVLYGTTGNPNFPVNILLSLEYIKHWKGLNDQDLLDAFYFDYQVNYAVGIRVLGEMNLAPRTLYYFRERIYTYCLNNPSGEELLFSQFNDLLQNFIKLSGISMEEQRTDTTLFKSNIKKAGRISLAYDVLLKAVKGIPEEALTDSLKKVLEPDFKTYILYKSRTEDGESRLTQLLENLGEANEILKASPDTMNSDEARIAQRFLREQAIIDKETGNLVPKDDKDIKSDSLQSAHDEDATFRRKNNVSQSGYVLQLSETCGTENPYQLITDFAVDTNNTSDVEILKKRLEVISGNTGCTDMYVDGGYHSEDVHETAKENGIEIHLTDMTGRKPTKKIPATDFEIDEKTNVIERCPKGHTPINAGVNKSQTSAHFPHEVCANCPLKEQCYSKKQTKSCVVRIPLKTVKASRERLAIQENKRENTSKRAGIEGSNSALKRNGLDKLDVRGGNKVKVVAAYKVIAQNISRFVKFMRGGYKAKAPNIPSYGINAPIFS